MLFMSQLLLDSFVFSFKRLTRLGFQNLMTRADYLKLKMRSKQAKNLLCFFLSICEHWTPSELFGLQASITTNPITCYTFQ